MDGVVGIAGPRDGADPQAGAHLLLDADRRAGWELVCPVIAAIAAASGDSCVSAEVDGLVVCGVMPRTSAQMGCKLGLLTVSSISSATLDAGWRGRIGLGTGLGNAPARPLTAVAEVGDVDALGAVGRGDAAQLVRQALG